MKTLKEYNPVAVNELKKGDVVYDIPAQEGGLKPITMEFLSFENGISVFRPLDNFESVYGLDSNGHVSFCNSESDIFYLIK